jgi:hypothetical protein
LFLYLSLFAVFRHIQFLLIFNLKIMANWCVNQVSFVGDPENVLQVVQLFRQITYDQETNKHPEIPGFIKSVQANMVDFAVTQNGIYFRTPWTPAIETVRLIAEHCNVDYVHKYEEPGMQVYGEATCRSGVFNNIFIDRKDNLGIAYDEASENFIFEGRSYSDDWAIMIELLNRKRDLRDAGRSKETSTVERQLSQLELVAWRLAGKLPHIDINGTDFTIDLRLRELRETESPWNSIDIRDLENGLDSEDYLFFYDTRKRNIYTLDDHITELPENIVLIELPNEMILDPVAAARGVGYSEDKFLEEYPIQQHLKAGVRQLTETFLPEMIAENLRKRENDTRFDRKVGR